MRALQVHELTGPDGLRLDELGVPPAPAGGDPANRLLPRNAGVLGAVWRELLDHDHTLFARTAEQLAKLVRAGLRPLVTQHDDLAHGASALRAKVVLTTR